MTFANVIACPDHSTLWIAASLFAIDGSSGNACHGAIAAAELTSR